ncbi:hypothetical protein HYC85_005795 [Camellia sinensis]|uniref:Uncharacterized protein n=2 Tax=Camellia sinensis TaxID=4442 RepID=A0A7J7I0H6_CAMSI|nr:hypothetical protein HYC85_005795 [Camellia sinensis]THG08434.1 hypothetical protein TEA_006539 [Camellia sinensis var. sinensis]
MKRKRKRTNITDLNVDVLKCIMSFVAKSSDGAGSFARAISVCKPFMELAEDTDILKAIVFEKGSDSEHDESFWQINGLLNKCARAGNMSASHILLTYLEDRVESSWESVEIIESVKKNFIEKMMAVMAVFTRARLRAATLARDVFGLCTNGLMALIPSLVNVYVQELVWMLQDFLIDSQEIGDLIVGMKSAVIVEKG